MYPQARDDDGKLVDIGGEGIIIPLSEVSNIILSVDPTGAPTGTVSEEADAETQALPPGIERPRRHRLAGRTWRGRGRGE